MVRKATKENIATLLMGRITILQQYLKLVITLHIIIYSLTLFAMYGEELHSLSVSYQAIRIQLLQILLAVIPINALGTMVPKVLIHGMHLASPTIITKLLGADSIWKQQAPIHTQLQLTVLVILVRIITCSRICQFICGVEHLDYAVLFHMYTLICGCILLCGVLEP